MELLHQRLRSKTYWLAFVASLLTIAEANTGVLAFMLPLSWGPYLPLIFPVVFLIAREFTTTALADK